MIITFQNRQSKHDASFYSRLAKRLFEEALTGLAPLRELAAVLADSGDAGRPIHFAVSITLAGPIVMRRINREQRQIDRITDILSFPMLDMREGRLKKPVRDYDLVISPDGRRHVFLGDLVLSPDRAASQALEYGHSLERETAFLLTHGLLHLLGYDHRNRRQTAVMMNLTETFLEPLGLSRAANDVTQHHPTLRRDDPKNEAT